MYLTVPTSKRKWWCFAETTYLFWAVFFCEVAEPAADALINNALFVCEACQRDLWLALLRVGWQIGQAEGRPDCLATMSKLPVQFFTAPNWLRTSMLEKPAKSLQHVNMFVVWQIVPDSQPLQSLALSSTSHHFSSSRNPFDVLLMHSFPQLYIFTSSQLLHLCGWRFSSLCRMHFVAVRCGRQNG